MGQTQEVIDTLKDVQQWLPPFRAVFSPHDNPNMFTDWEVKSMMVRAAGAGKCACFPSHSFPALVLQLANARAQMWTSRASPR